MHTKRSLLDYCAVWTKKAVGHLAYIRQRPDASAAPEPLELNALADAMACYLTSTPNFRPHRRDPRGGLSGLARRRGWKTKSGEVMSPGRHDELDRIAGAYPEFNDDAFIPVDLKR